MFDRNNSLLPATATDLAKALDILEERLFDLPVQMITKDPQLVDPDLLDHLAWEHSVDVWDPAWPEDVKRAVIAVSAEVHRYKGTPYAIKVALSAFDVDTNLLEWWEPAGVADGLEAGSFRVTAYAGQSLYGDNENSINNAMLHALNAVVQRVAPLSRKLIFRLGERFNGGCAVQSATRQVHVHQGDIDPSPRPQICAPGLALRSATRSLRISQISHDPQPRPIQAVAGIHTRMAALMRTVSRETHNIQRRPAG